MRRMCMEYIFLSEIKGSESTCAWDRLSCHGDQPESALQNCSTVMSSHRCFHHTGCNRILSGVKPLRLGAMFGCKIVTELSLRRLSSPSLQAWSVHCQLQCKGRPQKLLWGLKRDCPWGSYYQSNSGQHAQPPGGIRVSYMTFSCTYIYIYTYKHMYTQKQIY